MSTFEEQFIEDCMPDLLQDLGTEVQYWPNGVHDEAETVTVLINSSNLAQGSTVESRGRRADEDFYISVPPSLAVTIGSKFLLPGSRLLNVIRKVDDGPMPTWFCIRPVGIDTKHARVR